MSRMFLDQLLRYFGFDESYDSVVDASIVLLDLKLVISVKEWWKA